MSKASLQTVWGSQSWLPLFVARFVSWRAAKFFCGAGWQPAADWQSACAYRPIRSSRVASTTGVLSTNDVERDSRPEHLRTKSRLKGGCRQDCLPHKTAIALAAVLALTLIGCNREHKVTVRETVEETPAKNIVPVVINMGDPKQEKQLVTGFYGIEANSWRWTAKDFTVSLRNPAGSAAQGATLIFALSIPQVVIDKLQSVTLSASINGTALAPETYAHDGQYEYKRDVPSNLLTSSAVPVAFHLNKSMPPAGGDARELGIVARSVGLESK